MINHLEGLAWGILLVCVLCVAGGLVGWYKDYKKYIDKKRK